MAANLGGRIRPSRFEVRKRSALQFGCGLLLWVLPYVDLHGLLLWVHGLHDLVQVGYFGCARVKLAILSVHLQQLPSINSVDEKRKTTRKGSFPLFFDVFPHDRTLFIGSRTPKVAHFSSLTRAHPKVTPLETPPGLINSLIAMAMRQDDPAPLWPGAYEFETKLIRVCTGQASKMCHFGCSTTTTSNKKRSIILMKNDKKQNKIYFFIVVFPLSSTQIYCK